MLDSTIKEIILTSKSIAVIGASRDANKEAHLIPKYLQSQGYRIFPVNPFADVILGEKAFQTLGDISEQIDIVLVFRPSEFAVEIVKEVIMFALHPKVIWLQLEIENHEAAELARKNNLMIVMNKCLKEFHESLHE